MEKENKTLTELNQEQLKLITIEDLRKGIEDMSVDERKAYVSRIASVFDILEDVCKNAVILQMKHMAEKAKTWEDVLIARGSINGISVMLEWFTDLNHEHIENTRPKEDFDPHKVI